MVKINTSSTIETIETIYCTKISEFIPYLMQKYSCKPWNESMVENILKEIDFFTETLYSNGSISYDFKIDFNKFLVENIVIE